MPASDDLFSEAASQRVHSTAPLADRMRPRILDDVVGQERLTGAGGALRAQSDLKTVHNFVLVGPPGTGKTTLARIIAAACDAQLVELSAVACGLAEVRQVIGQARETLGAYGRQTILFLDEIHRFNKAQQDALLPAVEAGILRLIGATTEPAYIGLNRALLSRLAIYELAPLSPEAIRIIIERAVADEERGLSQREPWQLADDARAEIVTRAGADSRAALTILEAAWIVAQARRRDADAGIATSGLITLSDVERSSDQRAIAYDRAGDAHYDSISAYIKSMRKGDSEGALTYLAAMLEGGEDPLFIARRLAIFASEDVGNADFRALLLATAAIEHVRSIGMPEAQIALAQVTRYCAEARKSRQAYDDIQHHRAHIHEHGSPNIPIALTNRKP